MTEATLVVGLILQRFRWSTTRATSSRSRKSLTIKPEGLMMRVKLRPDVVRGSGVSVAARAGAQEGAPRRPPRATAPGSPCCRFTWHAERARLPTRAKRKARATLAGLGRPRGQAADRGRRGHRLRVLQCGPPDNAGAFIKSLREADPGSLAGVRYTGVRLRQPRLGLDLPGDPASDRRAFAAKGAERIYVRGEGDAKEDLDGHFQAWNEPLLPALADKLGVTLEADTGGAPEPLYQVQPVDKPPVNPIIGGTGALPMRVLGNRELQTPDASGRSTRISR